MTIRDIKEQNNTEMKFAMGENVIRKGVEKESNLSEQQKRELLKKKNKKEESEELDEVVLFAPCGMGDIIKAMKSFLRLDNYNWDFHIDECSESKLVLEDHEMIIHCIPIQGEDEFRSITVSDSQRHQSIIPISDPVPNNPPYSVCYYGKLHKTQKFSAEKAKVLGVPFGAVRKKLIQGETITLDDGTQVRPDQVLESTSEGEVFLILDCASVSQLQNLVKNPLLQKYSRDQDSPPTVVFHLTDSKICQHPLYRAWVDTFVISTKHIYLHQELTTCEPDVIYRSQYKMQHKLHWIDHKFFPLIEEDATKVFEEQSHLDFTKNVQNVKHLSMIHLRCKENKFIDNSFCKGPLKMYELQRKFKDEMMRVLKSANEEPNNKLKTMLNADGSIKDICVRNSGQNSSNALYPKVVCFGTGASCPAKYRNVSSTLLFLSEDVAVLFDCGEGTYGQLVRHYGDAVDDILQKVKVIFVSHLHADHHLGLVTLLDVFEKIEYDDEDPGPPLVCGPYGMADWLNGFASISQPLRFRFIHNKKLERPFKYQGIQLLTVSVKHPSRASGMIVSYNGTKVVYSGDTKPCEALIEAGQGATVLIHEATMGDDMEEEAVARSHSTVSQALDVGQNMEAENVILTHFSQRYPKIPELLDNHLRDHTVFAFDHMEISVDDIPVFHKLLPLLNAAFGFEAVDGENEESENNNASQKQKYKKEVKKEGKKQRDTPAKRPASDSNRDNKKNVKFSSEKGKDSNFIKEVTDNHDDNVEQSQPPIKKMKNDSNDGSTEKVSAECVTSNSKETDVKIVDNVEGNSLASENTDAKRGGKSKGRGRGRARGRGRRKSRDS